MTAQQFIDKYYICRIELSDDTEGYVAYSSREDMLRKHQYSNVEEITHIEECEAIVNSIDTVVVKNGHEEIGYNFIRVDGEPYAFILSEI
jgi:hypothetical protein